MGIAAPSAKLWMIPSLVISAPEERDLERLEKKVYRNSMKIIQGKCVSPTLEMDKVWQEKWLGPAGWEHPCNTTFEDTRLAAAMQQCSPPSTIGPGLHWCSQQVWEWILLSSLGPVRHSWMLSPAWSSPALIQRLKYWCKSHRCNWGHLGWSFRYPRRSCRT